MGFFKDKISVEEIEEKHRLLKKNPADREGKSGRKVTFLGRGPTRKDEVLLRKRLCALVTDGIYTRKRIIEILYKQFPRYKNKESISPRITQLCEHSQAYYITKYTGGEHEGKVAQICNDGIVRWNTKTQHQSFFGGDSVRKSTDYRKRDDIF